MVKTSAPSLIPVERIAATMYSIRGQTVMFDADLAALYGVETRVLVQAVKRNAARFPEDFMFRLTDQETENLRSPIVTSSWGGRRYNPYASALSTSSLLDELPERRPMTVVFVSGAWRQFCCATT